MSANPQGATVRALKTMWRKRYDEAGQRGGDMGIAAVMTPEWRDTLDRLVTLRAEMREIAHALDWAEKGLPWHGLTDGPRAELAGLLAA